MFPDPYFGLPNGFQIVYTMLDEVCDAIATKLINKHPKILAIKFS
jgi:protein-tyrosine phosphatase